MFTPTTHTLNAPFRTFLLTLQLETRAMTVVFYVDPALPRDVKIITLSYTFFEIGGGAKTAG